MTKNLDERLKNIIKKLLNLLYIYRFDFFALIVMSLIILLMLNPIFRKGHIVFSDMAFGFTSKRYMEEIFGCWNERWSTSTLLNVPRLFYIAPLYYLSTLFNYSGPVLLKSFITTLIITSALSMYLFTKRIVSVYFTKDFNLYSIFALLTGAIFYALNPWVIFRIQHIYLLCGYSLFPLIMSFFFNVFDPNFQKQLIPNYSMFKIGLYKRNILDLFLLSFFFTLSAAAIHYFFYGMIFLALIGVLILIKNVYFLRNESKKRRKAFLLNILLKIIIFAGIFGLLSSYWLFMYVGSILFKAQASQHNINVVDTLSLFSRYSSLKNVVYFISYWWPMFDLTSLPISFYLGGGLLIGFALYAFIFKAYNHHVLLLFSISLIFFMFVATGTTLNSFDQFFVILVTKTPIIGTMFRDPNKLVGLMAVGFSILLTYGVQSLLFKLNNNNFHNVIKMATIALVVVSFWIYLKPMYHHFIDGFYAPITPPQEYLDVQDHLIDKESFDSKILYLPIADNMTQSHTGVATPYWNTNTNEDGIEKATGDLHVYTSQKNTIFHHEGNAMSITYYINFLQYLLDKGRSKNIGELISAFGVNEFAYHNEYLGQALRQSFNEKILSIQKGLTEHYKNNIFTLYDVENPLPYLYEVPQKIFTPYGYTRLESYLNLPNFNFKDLGVVFTTLDEESYISMANQGDYIEVNNKEDLYLSNLPKDYYCLPFEYVNDGNAFLKWSKTLAKNNDWLWYLSSQNLNNYPFDFDFGAGIALTYATSKLDVLPYDMDEIEGRLVADFDSLLRTDKFFKPDNPDIFNIVSNPVTETNNIPVLKGEIIKGDPNNIWQVAKSGLLDAKENNPYQFNIVISGRSVNKMHIKVRFYDENMAELGASYVVAPSEQVNFETINFTGDYVSPAHSKYMRIDILTFQRPEQKSHWWIHDVQLFDLEDYKAPNIIHIPRHYEENTTVKVYLRTLLSDRGGLLGLNINGQEIDVPTYNDTLCQFKWLELGEFEFKQGENTIDIENKEGFNAINLIALVPVNLEEKINFPTKSAIERSHVFSVLEAEYDFNYDGNMQSRRAFPILSMGKGIASDTGILEREIDIVKTGRYSFDVNVNANPNNKGHLTLVIINHSTGEAIKKTFDYNDFNQGTPQKDSVIDYEQYRDFFPQEYLELDNYMNHHTTLRFNNVPLTIGDYTIRILFDSHVSSLSSFSDLHKFDPSEIIVPDAFQETVDFTDCSQCESIDFSMMQDAYENDMFQINYDRTCSCSWYNYASRQIEVNPKDEYLVRIEARSETVKKRHMKVMFLDENHELIDVTYIDDVDEKDKINWHAYEQIVKAPANSAYMQLHILARGIPEDDGFLLLKNYSIIPYKELITVDNLWFYEANHRDTLFIPTRDAKPVEYTRVDSMKRTFTVSNENHDRILLNFIESPNPLWNITLGDDSKRGTMTLNGVSTAIITNQSGDGTIEAVLRKLYYLGFLFVFLGLIASLFLYLYVDKLFRR